MRRFISIDLRQWPTYKCAITLRDKNGAECILDGLAHGAPHTHALVEIECDKDGNAVIELPGFLCDYHMDNGKENAERKPHPAPRVKRDKKGRLIVTDETMPYEAIMEKGVIIGKRPLPAEPDDMTGPLGVET